jgi:hypothetical protein
MDKQNELGLRPGITVLAQAGREQFRPPQSVVVGDGMGLVGSATTPDRPWRPINVIGRPVLIPIAPVPVVGVAPTTGAQLTDDVDGAAAYTFTDVGDPNLHWYVPTVSVVAPTASLSIDASPFAFQFRVSGHDAHGAPVIDATVTATVQVDPIDPARAALPADATTRAVPLTSMSLDLVVPFRDSQSGQPTSTSVPATTLTAATSTPSGEGWTATFELTGDLARAAYGSLSTAGYQEQSTQLTASYTFDTKQRRSFFRGIPLVPVTDPNDPLAPPPRPGTLPQMTLARAAFARPWPLSAVQSSSRLSPALVGRNLGAQDLPGRIPIEPVDFNPGRRLFVFGWRTVALSRQLSLTLFAACRDFPQLYVDTTDPAHPQVVGCQDAIALGTAPSRLYTLLDAHTTDDYTVFASNGRPWVYLLLPRRYRVGRTAPGAQPGVADFSPAIRWVQAFDATHDAQLPCQLQASLVPDLTPATVAELIGALAAAQAPGAPAPTVLLPTSSGSGLTDLTVSSWNSAQNIVTSVAGDNIQFVAAMGWNEAVVFNANVSTGGSAAELVGNANFALTDGESLPIVELHVGIDELAGPWPDGAVIVAAGAPGSVTVRNNATGTATVAAVLAGKRDGSIATLAAGLGVTVDPGAQVVVPLAADPGPDGALLADYVLAQDTASIGSQRVFLEDLHTMVTVIDDLHWSDAGLTQVDLAVRLDSDTDSMNLTMTPALPYLQLDIVQPLAGDRSDSDNLLHFTWVTHATDGTVSTPVQTVVDLSKGVLVSLSDLLHRSS